MNDPHSVRTYTEAKRQYRLAKARVPNEPEVLARWSKLRKQTLTESFPKQWRGLGYAPRSVSRTRRAMRLHEYQRSTCPHDWCREAMQISDFCLHHQGKAYVVFSDFQATLKEFFDRAELHLISHPRQHLTATPEMNRQDWVCTPLPPPALLCSPPPSPPLASASHGPPSEAPSFDWWL